MLRFRNAKLVAFLVVLYCLSDRNGPLIAQATQPEHPEFRDEAVTPQATATITFRFENAQLQPAKYEMTVHADGTGHYVSHAGSAPPDDIADLPARGQEREIRLTAANVQKLFSIAAKEHHFATKCEAAGSKVAFQGTKTLMYEGPDGQGACTYNYSQDQKIQWISTEFIGLSATLEEGRRLNVEHEHGRLALDAELETLETLVHEGQATEVQNIAATLTAITSDEAVMVRARRRAQALLDNAPPAN